MNLFLYLVSKNGLSRFVGWAASRQAPSWLLKRVLNWYIGFYNVDLAQVKKELSSFPTFNDFFIRELVDGARPIGEGWLVSPVDGVVSQSGPVRDGLLTQVKGKTYSVAGLLESEEEAARFSEGSFATIYLSPRDYHRIHSPVDGKVERFTWSPGALFPVNNLALPRVDSLFNKNERWTTFMNTDNGYFALVKVGATSVGSISTSYDERKTNTRQTMTVTETVEGAPSFARGDEIARFNLGSTVVLLTEKRCEGLEAIPPDTYIQLGTSIA